MPTFTRRRFLRSAGGLTFLALSPIGKGLFAAPRRIAPLAYPIFTAVPYIQAGPEGRLIAGAETVRLAWQTQQQAAAFEVRFGVGDSYDRTAAVERSERAYGKDERDGRFNYVCAFGALDLGSRYRYRVYCNGLMLAEGYFSTRQPRGRPVRFVAFGDNSFGEPSDRAVAYQAYRAHPDFIMNVGDNVYEAGLDNEYSRYFFPVYNADVAGPGLGAPLMRSVPFYSVLGNHDVKARNPAIHEPCADFDRVPDSLAYYTNFHFPLNGPAAPSHPTPTVGRPAAIANFKACARERFPRMANYSYDYGDVHFLCFDSNVYADTRDPLLREWIAADLGGTDARWKFAVCHHPPFNVGLEHYHDQQVRTLSPLFERHGVDFVLGGHEHNYQRSVPMRFEPGTMSITGKNHVVPGRFTLDTAFDGASRTKPDGVIYLVTGAGGKHLYDAAFTDHPDQWTRSGDKNAAYVAQVVSDRHSITVFDVEGDRLLMRQIDERGTEIDRITVTKA